MTKFCEDLRDQREIFKCDFRGTKVEVKSYWLSAISRKIPFPFCLFPYPDGSGGTGKETHQTVIELCPLCVVLFGPARK